MGKFHISKAGNVVPCKAVKGPCRAQPPSDLEQVHAEDSEAVYRHMERQYHDVLEGVRVKRLPAPEKVTPEIIGSEDTDSERTLIKASRTGRLADSHQLFLHDTEGRAIAFIQVNTYHSDGRLGLCDIEVRPEYRGHKLARRLIKATEEEFGKKMTHEGGYTPDGLKHIAPLFKSEEGLSELRGSISTFSPMTFIDDWEREWPKYPL